MKCMALIALIIIISLHVLKIGSFIFLLLVVCTGENSMAHVHDHQEIDCEKSKLIHNKTISSK